MQAQRAAIVKLVPEVLDIPVSLHVLFQLRVADGKQIVALLHAAQGDHVLLGEVSVADDQNPAHPEHLAARQHQQRRQHGHHRDRHHHHLSRRFFALSVSHALPPLC